MDAEGCRHRNKYRFILRVSSEGIFAVWGRGVLVHVPGSLQGGDALPSPRSLVHRSEHELCDHCLAAFQQSAGILARTSAGDVDPAIRTHAAFFSVWRKYGFTPEGFNLATFSIQNGQRSYPLRPELIESTYWLFKATGDLRYLDAGRDFVASLQYGCRCPCGYCHISDVESHKQDDHMESFFLSETVKYLWLLFDLAAGPDNIVENGPYKYIFSTEGHLLPATPEISLSREHCSYLGSFCRDGAERNVANDSQAGKRWDQPSTLFRRTDSYALGFIKGFCPALSYETMFGISFYEEKHEPFTVVESDAIRHQEQPGIANHENAEEAGPSSISQHLLKGESADIHAGV